MEFKDITIDQYKQAKSAFADRINQYIECYKNNMERQFLEAVLSLLSLDDQKIFNNAYNNLKTLIKEREPIQAECDLIKSILDKYDIELRGYQDPSERLGGWFISKNYLYQSGVLIKEF